MIKENIVVEFGRGNVGVGSHARYSKNVFNTSGIGTVEFKKLSKEYPIGFDLTQVEETAEPSVILEFSNIESLDVVLKHLNSIRKNMLNVKEMSSLEYYKFSC